MAGNIKLSPEELRQFANDYTSRSGDVHEIVSKLDVMIEQLQAAWEGSSSTAFANQYKDLKPSFTQMGTLLEEISAQLGSAATTLENTDNEIAGKIGH
ncbi:WXG100 family type VII secretion target [Alkalicoccobacillus murimartini]|uniref:ESAT-6-like protein n=1 Tax=Alkalicoccobacillus murimartini TaxID=171685 RepID=A0ABT9YMT4_9BACI|nr:WXG100 family type VII secretion target [Alkalicoccobacillus murimartini]MDQ0208512.1 WXG100 family type VII secretion target [Alkalicoccobacillus murimartini]